MKKEDFLKTVDEQFSNDDFYNLCVAFMDVGLNSGKFRTEDGKIAGKFYDNDINRAAEQLKYYRDKYSSNDNDLKKAIRIHAHNVISDDDNRQPVYFDQETRDSRVAGTLYFFTDLPDNIVETIFKISKE